MYTSKYSPVPRVWQRFSDTAALNIIFLLYNGGSLEMLTIEHEHIVHLIMLTMIIFNCIALNGFLSKKFNILQTFFLCIHCNAENLSTLQQ